MSLGNLVKQSNENNKKISCLEYFQTYFAAFHVKSISELQRRKN